MIIKKLFILLFALCCLTAAVSAAPGIPEQMELIADNTGLWKQDVGFGLWGYIVTDLDRNGRMEIISASLQGTGMYTYINIFEVSEDSLSLNEVKQDRPEYDSAPDIMTDRVKVYHDEDAGRYYYIFTDMVRNGYAENYENKRAVWLEDSVWNEIPLAHKSVIYSDAENYTETFEDASGNTISEEEYTAAEDSRFGNITPEEVCLNWQMTDSDGFSGTDRTALLTLLEGSASSECPEK